MADEPSSSGRRDREEQSADESATLIDTVTDPSLEWVGVEPRGTASIYSRDDRHPFTVIEEGQDQPDFQQNFVVMLPSTNARICSVYPNYSFAMYEIAFKDLGLRLPFTDFQTGVFMHLELAPSQLHPNSLAFIRAFELTCRYLR